MPEPTSCQELQTLKTLRHVECPNYTAPVERRVEANLQEQDPQKCCVTNSDQIQVNIRKCPESAVGAIDTINQKDECCTASEDAKNSKDHPEPENPVPDPLGPLPRTADHSAPPEYWSPLADLTKTRPAVEQLSVTRYSPAEWRLHNEHLVKDSQKCVQKELLTSVTAHRCMASAFAQSDRDQQDNNVKLSTRLNLVGRWKVELQREIAEYESEMNAIQGEKKRLLRCSQAVTFVSSINQDVKKVRCMRIDPELVRDEVEDELSNEYDLCADIQHVYTRCLNQVKMQLQELKDAKRRLELDLSDKNEAWNIDAACRKLNSTSLTLEWKAGSVQMPPDQSTPTSYEDHCREAIVMSQTSLQRSRMLRSSTLHDIYEKSVRDLRAQADCVDIALTKKIDETVQITRRIENELNLCLKALSDAEALVEETRAGTRRLDGAMKCSQTRLGYRLHRSKVENCRDVPQFGLIDEVKALSEGVSAMLTQIANTSGVIDELTKARQALEKDLVAKRKSLWVDRERCRLLRSFYPSIQVLSGL